MVPRIVGALFLVSAAGCSTREVVLNDGAVCAVSQAAADNWRDQQAFSAGNPVHLRYFAGTCLSSSCDTDREASCSVRLEGSVLVVESRMGWSSKQGMVACTDDCQRMSVTCESPPLAAGTYTIRHGDHEVPLTIPSEPAQAPCTTDPMW